MADFELELHPEKTRRIEFGRFAQGHREHRGEGKAETFTFLGFTHYCATNSKGHFVIRRKTMVWDHRYPALSQSRPDVYGAATSRAEAQALRLSAIYAALAVWDYCLASARLFFDASPVNPTAQRIGEALDAAPEGLTRNQIRGLFHGHVSKERIDLALEQLSSLGLINRRTETGRGRSSTCGPESKTPKRTMRGLNAHSALNAHTSPSRCPPRVVILGSTGHRQ